ncbi:MAG TPA: inositol monophosphatase family protein [Patescibacteria group bacterium]|nr:inositol monophosphatase family protein [Patescibacteria group bacterium]
MKIKKTAKQAALKAGKELSARFDKFDRGTAELKSNHEILTRADLAAEKKILSEIKNNFPEHRILSEEAGDTEKDSDYLWVVDPLDGTTNFSMHNPLWSVSIGVFYKEQVVLGIIYAPFLNELFLAEVDQGSKIYSPADSSKGRKMQVSNIDKGKVLNAFCHGSEPQDIKRAVEYHKKQKLNNFDCRQLGSAAIELAFVAAGRIESIVIPGAHPWDVAAGVLLVQEAGGKVTDADGKKWNLESRDMLASNGKVHKQILDSLK